VGSVIDHSVFVELDFYCGKLIMNHWGGFVDELEKFFCPNIFLEQGFLVLDNMHNNVTLLKLLRRGACQHTYDDCC
jgi:hypothetical protein